MSTSSNPSTVLDLPGLGEPTLVHNLHSKLVSPFQADAQYLRLDTEQTITEQSAAGEMILFCVSGQLEITVGMHHQVFEPNQIVHVNEGTKFELTANQESAVLIVSLIANPVPQKIIEVQITEKDQIEEASEESFPASDPPSFNATTT
ncbi:hypothetical protein GC197_00415 [bacterium]|nr:hypothetical protein [bacterium]